MGEKIAAHTSAYYRYKLETEWPNLGHKEYELDFFGGITGWRVSDMRRIAMLLRHSSTDEGSYWVVNNNFFLAAWADDDWPTLTSFAFVDRATSEGRNSYPMYSSREKIKNATGEHNGWYARSEDGDFYPSISTNIPIFWEEANFINYLNTGDPTGVYNFEIYKVTTSSTKGGEISVNTPRTLYGSIVKIDISIDDGYLLDRIEVDGEVISGRYFEMPEHDVTVKLYTVKDKSKQPQLPVKRANLQIYKADKTTLIADNASIIDKSFSFTESVCSGDTLSFGFCEKSVLRFAAVGMPNLKGQSIYAELSIIDGVDKAYDIPLGLFCVDECERNHQKMEQRDFVCYTAGMDLSSDYESTKMSTLWKKKAPYTIELTKSVADLSLINLDDCQTEDIHLYDNPSTEYHRDLSDYTLNIKVKKSDASLYKYDDDVYYYKLDYEPRTLVAEKAKEFDDLMVSKGYESHYTEMYEMLKAVTKYPYHGWTGGIYQFAESERLIYPHLSVHANESVISMIYFLSYLQIEALADGEQVESVSQFYEPILQKVILPSNTVSVPISIPRSKVKKDGKTRYTVQDASLDNQSLTQAYLELNGGFIKPKREGGAEFVRLDQEEYELELSEDYYESAWWDELESLPIGQISCTYTDSKGEAHTLIYPEQSEVGSCLTYDISDSYLVQIAGLSQADMLAVMAQMYEHVKGYRYMPVQLKSLGIPWLEAGAHITIKTKDKDISTYVLRRNLTGLASLRDSITAEGITYLDTIVGGQSQTSAQASVQASVNQIASELGDIAYTYDAGSKTLSLIGISKNLID